MASGKTVDQLIIEIKADTRQLKKELKQIEGKIKVTGAAGGAAFGAMGGASGALAGSLKKLAGPAAIGAVAIGIVKLGAFATRAGMEFEDLKDSLDTVFGSVEAGDKQFKRILDFAQTTPFQIDTVTKAFISLGSVGIEPTQRMMQVFADTASVAVDQKGAFEALIRVVQRAEAGALGLQELNMLADRGIDVFKGLKDELGLSRLELTDFGQTAGGAKIIVESLVTVLEKQFGGAMVSKMDNLSTGISNMSIAFKNLGNEISESGLGSIMKSLVNQSTDLINNIAISVARLRGAGIGISLESPQITQNMKFEQMQKERERAARANISLLREKMGLMSDIANKEKSRAAEVFENVLNRKSINPLTNLIQFSIKHFTDMGISADVAKDLVTNLNVELANQSNILMQSTKTRSQLNKEEKDAMLIAGKNVRVFGLLQKSIEDAKGDTELFAHAQTQLGEIFKANSDFLISEGIESPAELGKAFKKLAAESGKLATVLDDELQTIVTQTSHAFATDFVNALLNSESALESFKSFAQSMVAQILATFMQLKIINPVLNSIFGAGTFVTGGGGTSTGGGGIGMAGGGAIQGGRPTLVGERGPEIFVPNTGGTIMNNMNSKNAMSGGTTIINQSINFATGVVPTVRAEIMSMLPQIAEVSKGAVAEAAMRGGSYRRALQGNG